MTETSQKLSKEKARERLELAMKITGKSASALAKDAGLTPSTLSRFLHNDTKHSLSLTTIIAFDKVVDKFIMSISDPVESVRLMKLYNGTELEPVNSGSITIKVRGEVQAGHWHDAAEHHENDMEQITLPRPDGHKNYFGLRVKGDSMNLVYPEGTILVCVPMTEYNHELEDGDHVIVESWDAGLVEATVKEYKVTEDGKEWLWPRSTRPEFQAPIALERGNYEDEQDQQIRVSAIVVADYRVRKKRS